MLCLLFKSWMSPTTALSCASDLDLWTLLSFTVFLLAVNLFWPGAVTFESFLSLISALSCRHMIQLSSSCADDPLGCGASLLCVLLAVFCCLTVLWLTASSWEMSLRLSCSLGGFLVTNSAAFSSSSRFSNFLLIRCCSSLLSVFSTDPEPMELLLGSLDL